MTRVPMLDLRAEYEYMKNDLDAAIARCLDHQQWIFGPEVKEFEDKVAEYLGVQHCIGTSSGTDALVLALRALAIKTKGQEYFDRSDLIITTPFTFTATGDAILRAGATPLFVDINPTTYDIDPALIRKVLAKNKEPGVNSYGTSSKVVGILPVHLYGRPCQMDEIMAIAVEYGLFVIEDCAQAFGAKQLTANSEERMVGGIGDIGCFSFFPSKNLGGFGDAGMVSTNDNETAELIRMLIKHGGKNKYHADHIGYNARIDTIQAAILLVKLRFIDEFNNQRRYIASLYNEELKDLREIVLPSATHNSQFANADHVYHQYTIWVKNGKRDGLQNCLKEKCIDTAVYYPFPLHKMKVFIDKVGLTENNFVNAETATKCVLSLPVNPLQDIEATKIIIKTIKNYYGYDE